MLTANDIRAVGGLMELKHPGLLKELKKRHWTLGHFIAAFGNAEHMILFCTTFPEALFATTSNGLIPLELALEYGNLETANAILFLMSN